MLPSHNSANLRSNSLDSLRGAAIVAVLMINFVGYNAAPNFPLTAGAALPGGSFWAAALIALSVFLFQGKGWAMLAFIFGYSLGLAAQRLRQAGLTKSAALKSLAKRKVRLVVIGIAHGVCLYFGDVLTLYGLAGLLLAQLAFTRSKIAFKAWGLLGLISFGLNLFLVFGYYAALKMNAGLDDFSGAALISAASLSAWFAENVSVYMAQQIGSLFSYAPLMAWLMLGGLLFARLQNAQRKSYFAARLKRVIAKPHFTYLLLGTLCAGLLANAYFGAQAFYLLRAEALDYYSSQMSTLYLQTLFAVPINCALVVAMFITAWRFGWQFSNPWLALIGRHALLVYLSCSLLIVLTHPVLLGQFSPELVKQTAPRFLFALSFLIAMLFILKPLDARGWRFALSRWLSAKT